MTESTNTETSYPLRAPWTIFWIALFVRIAAMTFMHTWHMRPYEDHFAFGYEMGRIARALVTGFGYADPFRGHTGPTAWIPPIYPWILAADFKLFGVYSALAAWVILAFDSVLNALIIGPVWEIAARCFNRKVAVWSAWIWALYPAAMQYAVKWVWEMTLSAFLFAWVVVLALRMRRIGEKGGEAAPSARSWAVFGLVWGLIALTNPSICLFLPVCGVWVLMGVPRAALWRRQIPAAVLAACVFVGCLAPWTYRNWKVFHTFVPVRANFGVELYLGNGPDATGLLMGYDHPFEDAPQLRLYHQMGEIAYAKMRGNLAKKVIAADPARFVELCLRRVYYFWFSLPHPTDPHWYNVVGRNLNYQFTSIAALLGLALALRRKVPAAWLFFWAFLLLPLTYYAVTVHARFRHPLEPLMAILIVYLFQSAEKIWEVRWFRRSRRQAA
ncbi:MAG TPA: glycosyltransferase family 39 protein [Acidobacteriaceae bacterium]|jgi:4-amino-4-deoxy-L-arabinose transferase-like glycosyltransferase|nr:glycosyltransferase family 39 protein [Acidobacteriaceae bacterium]